MENINWYLDKIKAGKFDKVIFEKQIDEFKPSKLKEAIIDRRKTLLSKFVTTDYEN